MIRLYTNENFPKEVALTLRNLGYDVLTVEEAGNARQRIPDEQVLEFALQTERVLITVNRKDFLLLHKKLHGRHLGIVLCTEDIDFVRMSRNIDTCLQSSFQKTPSLAGQLIKVYKGE